MGLSKRTFALLSAGTLLLLLYVHEQVAILHVSYSVERKERELARLSEDHKTAEFRLARLRSPQVLSQRMKESPLDMTLPTDREEIRMLKFKTAPGHLEPRLPFPFRFLSWLHFIKEAQAKTSKG